MVKWPFNGHQEVFDDEVNTRVDCRSLTSVLPTCTIKSIYHTLYKSGFTKMVPIDVDPKKIK